MSAFFRIEMLAAKHGDALLVEYGDAVRTRRLLIDGGPLHAYPEVSARLQQALPSGDQRVELVVISHVDTDHIEGLIRLLAEPETRWPIAPEQIWFNGWRHIEEAHALGGREGEFLSALLQRRADAIWNTSFGRGAVRTGALPGDVVTLADGMRLTLLSPDAEALASLRDDWQANVEKWAIEPGDLDRAWERLVEETKFHPDAELTLGPEDLSDRLRGLLKGRDSSKANRSSIAFLAEYAGKSCLFLADAHLDVVCAALRRLGYSAQEPLRVDAMKLSHHGSKHNLGLELFELVDARHYLVSSNGERHGHPDAEAIEAVIQGSRRRATLWFNYLSPHTRGWTEAALQPGARFEARHPPEGGAGIVVEL